MTDWERLPGENMRWYSRFESFRLAGPNRSILGAYNAELVGKGGKRRNRTPNSWTSAAKKYNWLARAEAYDVAEQQRITAEKEAWRRNLPDEFNEKYRFIYEEALKAWARSLEDAVTETSEMVEVPEVVKDAKGNQTVQNVQRMKAQTRREGQSGNPALLGQAQAALKAIREMFGVDAPTKQQNLNVDLSTLTDAQLQRIAAGEDPTQVLASTTEGGG